MAAKPDSKASDKKEPAPKRGKGLWIGAVVVVLIAAGVAAGWYFTRPAATEDAAEVKASPPRSDSIFVNMEPFTVNLADEGGERLAQVAIVLELASKDAQATLSKYLPIVRNNTLLLLSSQHTKTLLTLEGKIALAGEIALRTGAVLGWEQETLEAAEAAGTTAVKEAKLALPRKADAVKPVPAARREPRPNPVVAVHFSQLLVQ